MNHDNTLPTAAELPIEPLDEDLDDEFDTTGDVHRLAAHHFAAAAKYHLLAAAADDEADEQAHGRYGYLAYRHQLNAVQYAEIAAMQDDDMEDEEVVEITRA